MTTRLYFLVAIATIPKHVVPFRQLVVYRSPHRSVAKLQMSLPCNSRKKEKKIDRPPDLRTVDSIGRRAS